MKPTLSGFWPKVLPLCLEATRIDRVQAIVAEADARRSVADYDTGSISTDEAYLLAGLTEYLNARVVIEVGTFIGTSTCAMASASTVLALYTCDASNDCLPSAGVITTFPRCTSTQMLQRLAKVGMSADLCFFDGVLADPDVDLLMQVCGPSTVFAVHDYNYGPKIRKHGLETVPRKGIGNVRLLERRWPSHGLVEPLSDTTLALLVPEALL